MEVIRSLKNERIKNWCRLHEKKYREKEQKFLIENEHLLQEALQANQLETLILMENTKTDLSFDGNRVYVSEEVMKKLKMNQSMPVCMGVVHMKKNEAELKDKILLCDDIQDPGNLGTMIRSAYCFGFDTVIVSNKSVDIYNEKVIRSTQGALFHLNVIRGNLEDFIKKIKKENIPVYATAFEDAKGLETMQPTHQVALIFGNEGAGVSEKLLQLADEKVFIEMSRFDSLNVAMATTICTYWFRKR